MSNETGYAVFGLTVASDLPLPDLPRFDLLQSPDLSIRRGSISAASHTAGLTGNADLAVLDVPEVARFEVRAGHTIIVDPAAGADERNVRLFLLGSAMGVVLHQRRLLPLNANAMVIGGKAIAFTGHSGVGKSTLAAWFHDRGTPVLTDDVSVVRFGDRGSPQVSAGIHRLRLWRDALHRSGRHADEFEPTWLNDPGYDKFDVPLEEGRGALERVPMRAVLRPPPLI